MKPWYLFLAVIVTLIGAQTSFAASDIIAGGYIESKTGGFVFPDGSVQSTAAVTAEAWPQHCYHPGNLDPSATLDLTCYSNLPEPSGTWGASSGVPDGYYFLVTDVTITPVGSGTTTTVALSHKYDTNGTRMIRRFKVSSDETRSFSFRSPTLHLTPGDWLDVSNSSGFSVKVEVLGWITQDPDLILH